MLPDVYVMCNNCFDLKKIIFGELDYQTSGIDFWSKQIIKTMATGLDNFTT